MRGFYADGTKFTRQEGEKGHQGGRRNLRKSDKRASVIAGALANGTQRLLKATLLQRLFSLFSVCVRVCVCVYVELSGDGLQRPVQLWGRRATATQRPLDTLGPTRAEVMH